MPLLFDAHLDLAWNALSFDRELTDSACAINARERGMTDWPARGGAMVSFPEMRRGGVAVCLGTLLARSRPDVLTGELRKRITLDYRSPECAYAVAQGQLAYYRIQRDQGRLRLLQTADELKSHWRAWESREEGASDAVDAPLGMILAMEGADPIVAPEQTEKWYHDGLRVANLVHYGENRYAVGTGASGPLTPDGAKLLREFERVGIILDATHLSDPSFFQAMDAYGGPVIASHQLCRSLADNERQFTDAQLALLIERGAVIGAAFDAWMVVSNWKRGETPRSAVTLEHVAEHVDHICQLAGDHEHVAIGSDLDGGFGTEQAPEGMTSIADLQNFAAVLERRGYARSAIDAIFHGNWRRFFATHLPS